MYNKIYDFCKVRNFGGIYKNTSDKPQPRVLFLLDLLESEGIEYTLDKFDFDSGVGYNIILKGDSTKMVVAHHDIVNPGTDI
jgi:hypothetical protein